MTPVFARGFMAGYGMRCLVSDHGRIRSSRSLNRFHRPTAMKGWHGLLLIAPLYVLSNSDQGAPLAGGIKRLVYSSSHNYILCLSSPALASPHQRHDSTRFIPTTVRTFAIYFNHLENGYDV
jgi:hypothetical protein